MLSEAYPWDGGLSSSWDMGIRASTEEKLQFLCITQHCSLIPTIIQHALIASVCSCKQKPRVTWSETDTDLRCTQKPLSDNDDQLSQAEETSWHLALANFQIPAGHCYPINCGHFAQSTFLNSFFLLFPFSLPRRLLTQLIKNLSGKWNKHRFNLIWEPKRGLLLFRCRLKSFCDCCQKHAHKPNMIR